MDILDIFSWLPAKEMSLEEIEQMTRLLYEGNQGNDKYRLEMHLPVEADNNIVEVTGELLGEGKKVCYLLRKGIVIAAIGYKW